MTTNDKISVVLAGVTNGLGYTIAKTLVANPRLSVTLFTRSDTNPQIEPFVAAGAVVKQVDYTSIDSLAIALQGIHTVISTVPPVDLTPVRNLLKAAIIARVKRFAPSEFAFTEEANGELDYYNNKKVFWEDVRASGLEYTAFRSGLFMDLFAAGAPVKYEEAPLFLSSVALDIGAEKKEIPGTGEEKITFTSVRNIAEFVSAALLLDKWPEELGMAGETTTLNQVVRDAEEIMGRKFEVTYVTVEELRKKADETGVKGRADRMLRFLYQIRAAIAEGKTEIKPYLNEVTDVKPVGVKEFLGKYWGTK
ncbi:NAD-P-binding protein [Crucibulum laeve]|uniref:NAD-P-binding protein n=1 Tax=Crucibulum laeve TaxID=68775 RepID=A0A5C3LQH3_9AGAR|nr:NAD-P-binding protein [Crucibulum laeve]